MAEVSRIVETEVIQKPVQCLSEGRGRCPLRMNPCIYQLVTVFIYGHQMLNLVTKSEKCGRSRTDSSFELPMADLANGPGKPNFKYDFKCFDGQSLETSSLQLAHELGLLNQT